MKGHNDKGIFGAANSSAALKDGQKAADGVLTGSVPRIFPARPGRKGKLSFMPSETADQEILRERAAFFSVRPAAAVEKISEKFISFRIGSSEYGVPYRFADEIMYTAGLTSVPCTPPFVAGIINRRSRLLTVLDLKTFFKAPEGYGETSRIIVVSHGRISAGILADEITGYDDYDESALIPPMASETSAALKYVLGINRARVTILDMPGLLGDAAVTVNDGERR